jgi:hypothetical protein
MIAVLLSCAHCWATQVVFIDFDSRTGPGERNYSTSERNSILQRVEQDYRQWDFDFTLTPPSSGDFSTVFVNSGSPLGLAQQIDFRNLDRNDTAEVNVNGSASTSAQFVTLTANVISHELGHLQGLRHGDSFGPIGSGIEVSTATPSDFLPTYPGPTAANNTRFHIMESDGLFIEDSTDQFFGPRSAVKLTFNEIGTVVAETTGNNNSIARAQFVELYNMPIPDTNFRAAVGDIDFYVDAVVVTGSRSTSTDDDYYRFVGFEGDIFNFEVISTTIDHRIADPIDSFLTLFDSSGSTVDYYGVPAENDDEWEGLDSILIDVILPADGDYFVRVGHFSGNGPGGNRIGDYELFMYRLADAPLPPLLVGDFNSDGIVDAADYTVWRDTLGTSGTELAADANGDQLVDGGDYDLWRQNFGQVLAPAASIAPVAVPEPTTLLLACCAVAGATIGRRRAAVSGLVSR